MNAADERKSENQKLQFYRDQLIPVDDLETFKKNLILEMRSIPSDKALGCPLYLSIISNAFGSNGTYELIK